MDNKEKFNELIEIVETASSSLSPFYLMAYSDYQEQKYKEWFPNVNILRAPSSLKQ